MNKSNKTNTALSGYSFEGARATAVADIKRAILEEGQDKKQVELAFTGGLIAKRLFADLPRAEAIAKGKGIAGATSPGRKAKAGQAIRTADQETVWDSCRRQWTRCAKDAGVLKPRKPQGKRKAKPQGKGKGKPQGAPKLALKPKDAAMANRQLLNMAQMASGYCAKYKATVSSEASKLAADFLAGMAKLCK